MPHKISDPAIIENYPTLCFPALRFTDESGQAWEF